MRVYTSVDQLVGHTPLMEVKNIEKELGLKAKILVKLECFNPAGSAKDRVGLKMIEDYEKAGELKQGGTIIEPTSGNTGIGIASIAASRGYKAVIVMPDTMSMERQKLMKAYGAELVLSPGKDGMKGAIELAEQIKANTPGAIIAGQFENPSNPEAHRTTTGPEIYEDTDGNVDIFVAGIGTGGTITGTGEFLKSVNPEIKVVGFEPETSPLITKGYSGAHNLQGIGANFIPKNYKKEVVDEVLTITNEEAYEMSRLLGRKEGILAGITSGASLAASVKLAMRRENEGKIIVSLLPDTGERYLSTELFEF